MNNSHPKQATYYFCIVNFSSNQWNARLHQLKLHTHNDICIFPPRISVSVMKIIRQTGQNSTLLSQVLKVFVYYAYTSDSWKYRVVYIFNNSILYILLQALIVLFACLQISLPFLDFEKVLVTNEFLTLLFNLYIYRHLLLSFE